MAKHLNRSEIKAIKHIILTWDGKITWSDLCESVYKNLNRTITRQSGNDSNLLIVFYVQIMPDDFVMQLHRF
ncbi:Uncharacterised protein [Klebsiella variicola]|nr:Uncharacterised protein [Klebsiella variicola]